MEHWVDAGYLSHVPRLHPKADARDSIQQFMASTLLLRSHSLRGAHGCRLAEEARCIEGDQACVCSRVGQSHASTWGTRGKPQGQTQEATKGSFHATGTVHSQE